MGITDKQTAEIAKALEGHIDNFSRNEIVSTFENAQILPIPGTENADGSQQLVVESNKSVPFQSSVTPYYERPGTKLKNDHYKTASATRGTAFSNGSQSTYEGQPVSAAQSPQAQSFPFNKTML